MDCSNSNSVHVTSVSTEACLSSTPSITAKSSIQYNIQNSYSYSSNNSCSTQTSRRVQNFSSALSTHTRAPNIIHQLLIFPLLRFNSSWNSVSQLLLYLSYRKETVLRKVMDSGQNFGGQFFLAVFFSIHKK